MVKSINFVVLGKQDIASDFGKKGTVTDISLFDRKESGIIKTWVTPNGFPEKIQPLIQAINLAEYVIFFVDVLDRFTGEQIIALDYLKKEKGVLVHSFEVDESKLNSMIKGTVIENYVKVSPDELKKTIDEIEPIIDEGTPEIIVDHCFDVKGVGTVILGKITRGKINQYDNLTLFPHEKEVLIKSIQMHDDPVEESICPARVGLAIKGVKPDEVERGNIMCPKDEVQVNSNLELDFTKSPYFKGDLEKGQMCLVGVGLQIKAAKFSSINPLKLDFDKPIAYHVGGIALILKPESSLRILGFGVIK